MNNVVSVIGGDVTALLAGAGSDGGLNCCTRRSSARRMDRTGENQPLIERAPARLQVEPIHVQGPQARAP